MDVLDLHTEIRRGIEDLDLHVAKRIPTGQADVPRQVVNVDDFIGEPRAAESPLVGIERLGDIRRDFAESEPQPHRRIDAPTDAHEAKRKVTGSMPTKVQGEDVALLQDSLGQSFHPTLGLHAPTERRRRVRNRTHQQPGRLQRLAQCGLEALRHGHKLVRPRGDHLGRRGIRGQGSGLCEGPPGHQGREPRGKQKVAPLHQAPPSSVSSPTCSGRCSCCRSGWPAPCLLDPFISVPIR